MANIGVSKPYYSLYTENNGTVTYGALTALGRATSAGLTVDNKEPDVLYADNGPAESLQQFSGGTVTIGIDELNLATATAIFGLTAPTGQNAGITFTGDDVAPYVATVFITKKIYKGTIKYRLVVLFKTMYLLPDYTIDTQGETITFQTPELTAKVFRSDDSTGAGKWQFWNDYETEAAAFAAAETVLGITP